MIELTKDNHFRFGYNKKYFTFRERQTDHWTVEYGSCTRTHGSFFNECLETAKTICDRAKTTPAILFSGGLDSEVVVRSFHKIRADFNVVSLKFKNSLNEHDLYYTTQLAHELKININYIELDILNFWKSQVWEYADPTQCVSPQFLPIMWLMDQIDGHIVLGSGECSIRKRGDQKWYLDEKEKVASWYRHCLYRKRAASPGFFQYSPEIMLSYLEDKLVQDRLFAPQSTLISNYSLKFAHYSQYFDLKYREKYTGYEKLTEYDQYYRKLLTDKFPFSNQVYSTELTQLTSILRHQS